MPRNIRVETELWDSFGDATKAQSADRSAVLRDFMAWYLRRPGAKMPTRPPAREVQVGAAWVDDREQDADLTVELPPAGATMPS
jgi:hypothetical protein